MFLPSAKRPIPAIPVELTACQKRTSLVPMQKGNGHK